MREPNYADIDGLFCRRGNRGRSGRRWSWRWLSGRERCQPAYANGFQTGTQDVGRADTRLDGTSGAGGAGRGDGCRRLPRRHRNSRNRSPSSKQQPQPQTGAPAPSANNARAEEKTANKAAAAQPVRRRNLQNPSNRPTERTASTQEAFAKARDADMKRAAAEQRRAERRQRWADSAASGNRASRSSRRSRRGSGKKPSRGGSESGKKPGREGCSPSRREPKCRGSDCSIRTDRFVPGDRLPECDPEKCSHFSSRQTQNTLRGDDAQIKDGAR